MRHKKICAVCGKRVARGKGMYFRHRLIHKKCYYLGNGGRNKGLMANNIENIRKLLR